MGNWKSEKLKDIGYTFTGLSGKKAADFGEGSPYIPYMNIFQNTVIDVDYMEYVKIANHEKQNTVRVGDVFFTTSSETSYEVGMSSVLVDNISTAYLNSFCFGYRIRNSELLDILFLGYLLRGATFRNQMKIAAQGSTRFNLSKTNFGKMNIRFPENIKEQAKIAEILFEVDSVIDKTRKLIDKYKCVKDGLLQDLLANGIDEKGNIRSPQTHQYKDSPLGMIPVEWECVELETTCRVYSGSTPKTNVIENWNGNNIWLTPNDLSKQSNRNIYNSERKLTRVGIINSTGRLLPVNSIIVSCRAPVGYCAIVKKEFSFNQGCKGLVIKENNDFEFLYYLLSTCKLRFELVSSGTTFLELSKKELQRFKIVKPCIVKEQREIAKQFIAIDDRIQTEEKYLNKILNIKKGLMQDLLNQKKSVDCLL